MNIARLGTLVIKCGLVLAAAMGLATTVGGAKADTIDIGWSSSLAGLVTSACNQAPGVRPSMGQSAGRTSIQTTSAERVVRRWAFRHCSTAIRLTCRATAAGTIFIWITESNILLL